MPTETDKPPEALARENDELRARLIEAEETIRAIRLGEIDALVVTGPRNDQVFMLEGADHAYRVMVEQMNESAVTLRTDGLVLFCNSNFFNLLESPAERVRGRYFQSFVSPDDQKLFASLLEQAAKDSAKGEVLLKAASGRQIPVLLSLRIMRTGGPPSISMLITDLSEQKKSEALRRTAKRLAEAQRIAQVGDWAWDPEANKVTWSDQMFEILGMDPSAPVPDYGGQLALYHPESAQRLNEAVTQALERGGGYELELKRTRPDGSQVDLLVRGMTEQDEKGCPHFLYGSVQDITKRKQSEEALQRSEERYRSLFMSQLDAFALHEIILDDSGKPVDYRFLAVNPAFEKITGLAADKVLGRTVTELLPDIEPHWIEAYGKVALKGEALQLENFSTDLGRHFEVQAYCPERGQFAVVFRDVTRMINDSVALTLAKEASEAANKAKSEFLANMSHEIRTPLNGILGMLQLLQTTPVDDEQHLYLLQAVRASQRLTRLLSDILDLSRVEADMLHVAMDAFDFKDIMDAVIQLFTPVAHKKNLSLACHINPDIPSVLRGDAARLQQILGNLVGNAIKFTDKGYVMVEASPLSPRNHEEYRVLFSVTDTGIGIQDDKLHKLFKPFTQVSQGYRRDYQGAGLGLSICKRLVDLMGGNIAVESEVGIGTTFYFNVKLSNIDPQNEVTSTEPFRGSVLPGTLSILLAEDEQINRLFTARLAEKLGYRVVTVKDGKQALDALKSGEFDVVLMDIQMPVMDGVEATARIRAGEAGKDKASIPIVALTAYAMAGDKEKFLGAGMDGYLAKPMETEALLKVIEEITAKRQR
ncbi:PAS domain S-box protein [Megalodesulfovibrio gigas]|uniref:histidine kinase n=1 Tax=Megalodesulfovibrio gigas (strain ATCC 19364 / DSM 1382 / NCIMB 9332 / VKM B-1759) TaxID=1121448 RepID=T2GE53_MEGG1|nr:PAS domain S-box protein [Megalodesulfovibrio gigas]AGW14177.1 putative multi-sensor hybrid histidine kinase [Megalodesulfovibrio gigas DSM 1382 = ATCC 19364]